jgi:guanyl-specific ribonuclease Sa
MNDKRKTDRRKKTKKVSTEHRRGPRRLVCGCGGRIDVVVGASGRHAFVCLRCGKKH